jgi:CheY-like chemotaxis protein
MLDIPVKLVQFPIVDDHAFVRCFVSQHLKSCGIYRFIYAQDGLEAARLLSAI